LYITIRYHYPQNQI